MDNTPKIFELIISLMNNMAFLIVLAYVFSQTKLYAEILDKKITVKNGLLVVIIMGCFSIYGTISGVHVLGAITNIRNLGPEIAGFIAGPIVGFFTGLIGGVHRYYVGGKTALPCALATVLAGVFAGLFYKLNKREFIGLKKAAIFAASFEVFHSLLVLLISRPFDEMLVIESRTTLPRVLAMGIGITVFSFIIDNLTRERKLKEEKQKIESELQVASQIQINMLPSIFPAFPDRKEIDIHAAIYPAKEVGGDFYDFFWTEDNKLSFLIGDVSGKGVPAALFMVICKTLFKTELLRGLSPEKAFFQVNNTLVPVNQSSMFVTIFGMVLNVKSGEAEISNGGHNPPLLCRANGEFEFMDVPKGFVVGPLPDSPYAKKPITLRPGDTVFLYTDGVTEAMNPEGALFSESRLQRCLAALKDKDAKSMINGVNDEIKKFARGAEQSDDITMLVVKYNGA